MNSNTYGGAGDMGYHRAIDAHTAKKVRTLVEENEQLQRDKHRLKEELQTMWDHAGHLLRRIRSLKGHLTRRRCR